ncbi:MULTISPECIES: exodeoxyribonuclease VII small subunit [Flammeovirga]|uniref:Exodeoxyribonuclease VII small subunit n=2 Tax=Flammeovirga TaxID=59739 RepID=A0A3Q9FPN3_9BACT|nr:MULTISPECIES: exodeoxyribonuclease VII small subunit [Flammeovirga]AZQ61930.1 exodeoxyribonuclease VII small subunit [Flammeovirga pectinis]MBB6460737.1 exodeoxyribonuclease VII small subunit [Flammeovirga kamogawensis]QWG08090.1 exodeoxyribonuclease VII small subunit [Flammeovirga kamogawensis]TRX69893.1 exodeoxyribonuclease VII small subunit [Flammeovirga kamogawensis]
MPKKEEQLTYESALEELQNIQEQLDNEEVAIDDLSKLAQRAKFLVNWCRNKLQGIDKELSDIFTEED